MDFRRLRLLPAAGKRYGLTGKCLDILIRNDWPLTVQTKSPLILRDVDLLKKGRNIEAGFYSYHSE
jgi:DNA repair photolyase